MAFTACEVDAARGEQLGRLPGKGVVADRPDHADLRAGARGGQRLVGALAARRGLEIVAENRFARRRQAVDRGDEVEIDRADDRDHAGVPPFGRR